MTDIFDILFWLLKSSQSVEVRLSSMEVAYEKSNENKEKYSYTNVIFDGVSHIEF